MNSFVMCVRSLVRLDIIITKSIGIGEKITSGKENNVNVGANCVCVWMFQTIVL